MLKSNYANEVHCGEIYFFSPNKTSSKPVLILSVVEDETKDTDEQIINYVPITRASENTNRKACCHPLSNMAGSVAVCCKIGSGAASYLGDFITVANAEEIVEIKKKVMMYLGFGEIIESQLALAKMLKERNEEIETLKTERENYRAIVEEQREIEEYENTAEETDENDASTNLLPEENMSDVIFERYFYKLHYEMVLDKLLEKVKRK